MKNFLVVGLFCEDIRREINGQETIVGVLPDTMKFTNIPGTFPKIATYIRVNFDRNFELNSLSFSLFDPSGEELFLSVVDDEKIKDGFDNANQSDVPFVGFKSISILSPVNINKEGYFELKTTVNDETFLSGFLKCEIAHPESPPESD